MEMASLEYQSFAQSSLGVALRRLCMLAQLLQSCLNLCNPMDCSSPGSSVHGILQARILGELPSPPPGDFPELGIEPMSLAL